MGTSFSHPEQHGVVAGQQHHNASNVYSFVGRHGVVYSLGAMFSPMGAVRAAAGFRFSATAAAVTMPPSVDLRQPGSSCYPMPYIWNQGGVGSCTAHSTCAAFSCQARKQLNALSNTTTTTPQAVTNPCKDPSRAYAYYTSLVTMNGNADQDTGATNPIALGSLAKGVSSEDLECYQGASFAAFQKTVPPSAAAKTDAATRYITKSSSGEDGAAYKTLTNDVTTVQQALYNGYTVVMAFSLQPNQEDFFMASGGTGSGTIDNDDTGAGGGGSQPHTGGSSVAYLAPTPTSGSALGGHSVLIVGYNNAYTGNGALSTPIPVFVVRNSWTNTWGDQGYYYIRQTDITNKQYFSDLMIVYSVVDTTLGLSAAAAPTDVIEVTTATGGQPLFAATPVHQHHCGQVIGNKCAMTTGCWQCAACPAIKSKLPACPPGPAPAPAPMPPTPSPGPVPSPSPSPSPPAPGPPAPRPPPVVPPPCPVCATCPPPAPPCPPATICPAPRPCPACPAPAPPTPAPSGPPQIQPCFIVCPSPGPNGPQPQPQPQPQPHASQQQFPSIGYEAAYNQIGGSAGSGLSPFQRAIVNPASVSSASPFLNNTAF